MTEPNADQIRYWNETAGPKWVRYEAWLDAQIGPLGRRAMDQARIAAGEHVLDVGCGCGETTLELARRVGPEGRVLGLDVSGVMLERARQRASAAELSQVRFEQADAQVHRFEPSFDALFSRFGVMFFASPQAAFTNLRRALRPGGRLALVCWQALQKNAWLYVPLSAAARHITLPPPPAPDAPGPFSFADPERVTRILEQAGFTGIELESVEEPLAVAGGADLDTAVEFLIEAVGPTSAVLREADPALRPVVAAAVREALLPFATPTGVRIPAAAWIVTAREGTFRGPRRPA
jgi:SAM-dependent methyltransferase